MKRSAFNNETAESFEPYIPDQLRNEQIDTFYAIQQASWDGNFSNMPSNRSSVDDYRAAGANLSAKRDQDISSLGDVAENRSEATVDTFSEIAGVQTVDVRFDGSYAKSGGSGTRSGGGGTSGGAFSKSYDTTKRADGYAGYDIAIDFKGTGWTASLQSAFTKFADYLTNIISNDIGGGASINGKYIDDLYVSAELAPIDGSGGILGQAGPTRVWSSSNLTATGQMQFDSYDAENFASLGLWDDIVAHEMMHVLGFGSLWEFNRDLVSPTNYYIGSVGVAAYNALNPTNPVTGIAVETDGGAGTAGAHWDEGEFGAELMTGYINSQNTLSKYSVMSLNDLGYQVPDSSYQAFGV